MSDRTMTFRVWLAVWGVLAFIALAMPGVVALGLFFLLPGLILVAAPTVFLYSAGFGLVRGFLPLPPGLPRNAAAIALVLLLGWVAAQPGSIIGRRRFARANLPDVVPAAPVRLAGHVRLELPKGWGAGRRSGRRDPGACDELCAALLDTPGVASVTMATTGAVGLHTFRLIPRGADRSAGVYPVQPEAILEELPEEAGGAEPAGRRVARPVERPEQQAVAAAWALRLASREKLVAEPARPSADMTVRVVEDRRIGNEVSVKRVEILDSGGTALLRRSIVTGSVLSAPLHFASTGSLESLRVRLARVELKSSGQDEELQPVSELFRYSSLARPEVDPGALDALLARLREACTNPALLAGDPDFGLATLWLPAIDWRNPIPEKELAVLALVIADGRIPLPEGIYRSYESRVAPELRGALGLRILNRATPPKMRTQLARLLAQMPEGTFARLSADEAAFLGDADLRSEAYPMIVRLADQGQAAVPGLLAILKSDMQVDPWHRRNWVMHALSLAFAIVGPKAHGALEEVDALVNADRSRLLNSWSDRKRWYLALARMGKPLDSFQWFGGKAEAKTRDREALRRVLERFDRKEVWNY